MSVFFKIVLVIHTIFLAKLVVISTALSVEEKIGIEADLTPEVCKKLQQDHQKSATYQAGVDVYGRPVVGANVDGEALYGFDKLTIPLIIDPRNYAGLASSFIDDSVQIGQIDIDILSGTLQLNGYDLTDNVKQQLFKACHDR